MKLCLRLLGAACVLGRSSSQLLTYCPSGQEGMNVCYNFAEPYPNIDGTSAAIPDFYMQIRGPATKQWIALGQGNQMNNANMFIIYANAAGTNVTLSPRLGSDHDQPAFGKGPNVTLLAGSGIANGTMTANIRCRGCNAWNGGSMDLKGSGTQWIWASKDGSPINSDSTSANLQQHDDGSFASFSLDLNTMSPDNSSNPFLDVANSQFLFANGTSADAPYDGSAIPIHGVIMCLAFIIGFPFGAFLIRLASFRGLVWIHTAVQLISYLGAIIGLGLGVYIGMKPGVGMGDFHPIFGVVIVVLLIFQPILGYVHHIRYKRYQQTTQYTAAHVWLGRALVTAGLIDGLFGLTLAGQKTGVIVAYAIIAGAVWVLWAVVIFCVARRQKRAKMQNNSIRMAALVDEPNGNGSGA